MEFEIKRKKLDYIFKLTHKELHNIHHELEVNGMLVIAKFPTLHKLYLKSLDALVNS